MTIQIRPAQPGDAVTIAQFNRAMARETEGIHLDPERVLTGVNAVLDDPSKGFYAVATDGDRVVGQLMITFEWSDWRNGAFWWIQSVYVHPDYRRHGIFRGLYDHVSKLARRDPAICGIRLYVESENRRAQQTYAKMGMQRRSYQLYEVDFVLDPTATP